MEKIYRDADVDLSILTGKTIAVIGYGIQGKAQAANARDSGCAVIVGTRPPAREQEPGPIDGRRVRGGERSPRRRSRADVLLIELADPVQPAILQGRHYCPTCGPGRRCASVTDFQRSLRPDHVLPKDVNCVLYVPNAPGAFVRSKYQNGEGVYGCVAVDHDATGNAKAAPCWRSARPSDPPAPAWSR